MAFTDTERSRIRSLLGWGARFHSIGNALESSLDAMVDLAEDTAQIRLYLTQLDSLDATIAEAYDMAGVITTGSVTLSGDGGIMVLKAEGRRLVEAIAALLGVECLKNFYASGSPRGGIRQYG